MKTLCSLDVLGGGADLIFSAVLCFHLKLGQASACELHARCGTGTTLPSLKGWNEGCTRPDMKSHGNTLDECRILSCHPYLPDYLHVALGRFRERNCNYGPDKHPASIRREVILQPVCPEAGIYHLLRTTYILLN